MLKRYIAGNDLAVNVTFEGGSHKHISFESVTGGGSVYYTEDEKIQKALEKHPYYKKFYVMEEVKEEAPQIVEEAKEEEKKEVMVSCVDDAKDLLSEKYGVSRTKMKTLDMVKKAAENVGVTLKGI